MTTGGESERDQTAGSNTVNMDTITSAGEGNVNVAGGNIFQRITNNIFHTDTEQERVDKNRQNMLDLVWNTWIEGLLEKSLYTEVLMELGLETRPGAVAHPWDMLVQMPEKEPQKLPAGMSMLEVFDQVDGSLLILGEPGAGKTTMLLELCRGAIQRAREDECVLADERTPIPVVLNLSSWTSKTTLAEWLVDELNSRYYVSKKLGGPWVDNDALLLLLDGLDEVREDERAACVGAIHAFLEEHPVRLAVCCRWEEYGAMGTQLRLRGAVMIQPLNEAQVDAYLEAAGPQLNAVHRLLKQDADLQEFAQTPLILSVLVLAYKNAPEDALQALEAEESDEYKGRLFEMYIEKMFCRRGAVQQFAPEDTRKWLGWLASEMVKRSKTGFYIEDIQPSWLPGSKLKRRLSVGLIFSLIFGLGFGIAGWLIFWLVGNMAIGLIAGAFSGLIFGLLIWLSNPWIGARKENSVSTNRWQRLLTEALDGLRKEDSEPTVQVQWLSFKNALGAYAGAMLGGVSSSLLVGLLVGLFVGLKIGMRTGLGLGIITGLFIGLLSGLLGGLSFGLVSIMIHSRGKPGEGINRSLKNFLFVGISVGLFSGLIFGLLSGLLGGLLVGLIVGFYSGVLSGLIAGPNYGGRFLLKYFISHRLLYRAGLIPYNLVAFLDYCTERIFMRRVGGGYIFIHRMLMEHFAKRAAPTTSAALSAGPIPLLQQSTPLTGDGQPNRKEMR